ncbi:MAG: DUF2750 domain-containing protein [Gemmataceae bacterium]
MSYKVKQKELEAIQRLPAPQRYQYFLGKVADWEEIWSVGTEDDWALMGDDSGNELVPVWPAEAFASLCCVEDWADKLPKAISLNDWMTKWIPGMMKDYRMIAVFPLPSHRGIVVNPERMKTDLEFALSAYDYE